MGICDCEKFLKVSGRGVLEVSQRKGQGARSITPVRSQRAGDKPRPAAIWLAAGGTRGRPPLSPETEYATEKSRGNRARRVRCRSVYMYSSNVYSAFIQYEARGGDLEVWTLRTYSYSVSYTVHSDSRRSGPDEFVLLCDRAVGACRL